MDIDLAAGIVTFRIFYCGPEGATKFVNIRGLHTSAREDERRDLHVIHAGGDRIVTFPYTPRIQPSWLGLKVVYEAVAVPGRLIHRAVERLLVRAADAVIFLPERMHPGSRATLDSFAEVCAELARGPRESGPVPIYIPDYLDGEPRLRSADLDPGPGGISPVLVPVEGDTLEAIRSVFEAATAAILELESAAADCGRLTSQPRLRLAPPPPPTGQVLKCAARRNRMLWTVATVAASLSAAAWFLITRL